jgi:hypothetical protein
MKQTYSLASDQEPTEKQLAELMHEVAVDAKKRALESDKKLMDDLKKAIAAVLAAEKQRREKQP